MLDIGWSELILIGIVALIVVGPKDLPRMFHTLGRVTGKLRSMAREFQHAMDDAAKSAGLDEVRRDLSEVVSKKNLGLDALETAATKFEKWDPTRSMTGPQTPATQAMAEMRAAEAAAKAKAATAAEIAADADFDHEPPQPAPAAAVASGAANKE